MSSRVQKGGQKFRPVVAKARSRQETSSRQLSTVSESLASNDTPNSGELARTTNLAHPGGEGIASVNTRVNEELGRNTVTSHSTSALEDSVSSSESAPQKRSVPTIIAVGRSRTTSIAPRRPQTSDAAQSNQPAPQIHNAITTAPITPATHSNADSTSLKESSTVGPTSVPDTESTQAESMEALLSILQSFTNPDTGVSPFSGALNMIQAPPAQPGASQQNTIEQNPNLQPPSSVGIASDPYGTLALSLANNSIQPLDSRNINATTETSDLTTAKKRRRSRAKKSKENVDLQSQPEPATEDAEGSSMKRRRKSRTHLTSREQSTADDSPEVSKTSKRSSRRKKPISQETVTDSQSTAESADDTNEEEAEAATKRRKSTRKRRSRAPSVPLFDADANPGEDLDPTAVTMSTICTDTGQGRVSSKAAEIQKNFAAWKQQNKEKRARMVAIMEAKKYGRKEDDAVNGGPPSETIDIDATDGDGPQAAPSTSAEIIGNSNPDGSDDEEPDASAGGFDYSQAMSKSAFNVQVRIGPNGETIIDEESLLVDRAQDAEAETEEYTHVEESDQTKFVNSATYSRKARGSRWSKEETELFYDAVRQFGENYELISMILPGRDRKSCKNKFKAEDKKNPGRITESLKNRVAPDMETLSRLTGKDFSGPTPEIRLPDIPRLGSPEEESRSVPGVPAERVTPGPSAKSSRKRSRTPRAAEEGVEVVGDVDTFIDMDERTNET